jgi:hypothetical protein
VIRKLLFYVFMVLVLPTAGLGSILAICYFQLGWKEESLYYFWLPGLHFYFAGHRCAATYFHHTWWGYRLPWGAVAATVFWYSACKFGPFYLAIAAYLGSLHVQELGFWHPALGDLPPALSEPQTISYLIAGAVLVLSWLFLHWLVGQVAQAIEAGEKAPRRGRTVSERGWGSNGE